MSCTYACLFKTKFGRICVDLVVQMPRSYVNISAQGDLMLSVEYNSVSRRFFVHHVLSTFSLFLKARVVTKF